MHPEAWKVLFRLEVFQIAFLLLHDWVPVPPLNDVQSLRETDSLGKRLVSTVVSALPFVALLWGTYGLVVRGGSPGILLFWLWFGYGLLFLGELNVWWLPYLLRPDPQRAARYAQIFGRTHAFLPERNGIRPNTLHVVLHLSTILTLVVLGVLTFHF